MLLVLHNLPLHTRVQDVKSLIRARCGIDEMILDKLCKESKTSQSVTIGVANDEETAAIMRHINGYFLDGQQLYVEDMRKKNKPSIRPQRPDHFSNDQPRYRSPAPVRNSYGMDRQQSIQPAIPSLMSQPLFLGNMDTTLGSQNPYMDYGNEQQQNLQFGSQGGHNRARDEGLGPGQHGRAGPKKQDVGPGPSRYRDDRREPARDRGYDRFPQEDRKRRHSPDRSQSYNENRRSANDNSYREIPNYGRKDYSEKYDPEDAFTGQYATDIVGDRREFPIFQSDRVEPFMSAEHSNFGERYPNTERSPYGSHASGVQSKPYDDRPLYREDELRNPQIPSPWNEPPQLSFSAERNPQNSNTRWNETPQQPFKMDRNPQNTDRNRQNSNTRWNETPQQPFKMDWNPQTSERNPPNSNTRWNETPKQAFKMDRNPQKSSSRLNEAQRNPQNSSSRWNEPPQQPFKSERNPPNSNSRWNETPHQSYKTDSDVPPTKRYKVDDVVNVNEGALHKTNVHKAVTWRNEAVMTIAKKILRGRIHYKMSNKRYQAGLSAMKHIIKIQIEEVIKFAYPHENLAVVPVDEIINLYRRKFTSKDDDELFAKTYVVSDKANTLGLARKIVAGPATTPNREQAKTLDLARTILKGRPIKPIKPPKGKKQNKPMFKPNKPNAPGIRQSFTASAPGTTQGFRPNNPNAPGIRPSITPNKPNAPGIRPSIAPNKPNAPGIRPSIAPNKPNAPGIRPSITPNKPNAPGIRPSIAPNKPNAPGIRPSITPNKPNAPGIRPSIAPNKPNAPGIRPSITPNKPNAPGIRPSVAPNKPNAPGIRPSITPNKPNQPSTKPTSTSNTPNPIVSKTPSQNPSSKQNNPKQSGVVYNVKSTAQSNQARPGKLPQYIEGDKKLSVQQKQMAKREFIDDDVYKCEPDLEKAVNAELDEICNQYVLGCETTDEEQKNVAQYIRDNSLSEFRKTIRLHVVKRLLNIRTNLIARIFANGKPPSRQDVEQALKPFGVIILKKSISSKLMYVATCDSFENYDKLCGTDGIPLKTKGEVTTLVAKPFHLTMPLKFRRQLDKQKKKALVDGIQVCDDNDNGTYEDDNDDDIQVIEPQNVKDCIIIDDGKDDVKANDKVVEIKVESVDKKDGGKNTTESKVEDVLIVNEGKTDKKQDENNSKASQKNGGAVDAVDEVDIDEDVFDEDDLEDY